MITASIDDRVRGLAESSGGEPAILAGHAVTSWADLEVATQRVAARLVSAGVGRGDLVVVATEPAADALASILGVLRIGAAVAPLPSGLTAVERERAIEMLDPVLDLGNAGVPGASVGEASDAQDGSRRGRRLEGPAVVVMTSGTTGRPKGVILPPQALDASARAWSAALPPATGWLLALGLGHVAGLGVAWRSIVAGVPMRIVDGTDPDALLAALAALPPMSHVSLVPTQLARLLDHGQGAPPDTLRAVPLGGGRVPADLVMRALGAGWPVVPTYGLSEAGSGVTALASDEAREAAGSSGRPLPGVQVSIEAADADGIGEIVVTTPAGFSGYLGEGSRASRTPIRTGDLGRLDAAGRLHVVERRTDRIVRGGENIAPAEVEATLEAHPDVAEAAVVGRSDPVWGQVPVAALVVREGRAHPGAASLAAHARAALAGYKVPVSFVRVRSLPRTAGGKLQRAEVRSMLERPLVGSLARPDGAQIGWRSTGTGQPTVVLLHGTLSTAAQLDRLAGSIAEPGDVTVLAVDRRGSGSSPLSGSAPVDIAVHLDDLLAVLDHQGQGRVEVVGLSYGGVVALEAAARHPERVRGVIAWEPPYGPLADGPTRDRFVALAASTAAAHRAGGPSAAAEAFLRAVAGNAAWERLSDSGRTFLARQGDGALSDSALLGLEAAGLAGIAAPVTLLTGSASEPFYAPIARSLVERIPGAELVELEGLGHAAPLTEPARVAAAIRAQLEHRP